jgi:hypothetical protein
MSVTTTSNARILTTANYLADYDLHHSQPSAAEAAAAPPPNTQQSSSATNNPADWESSWRRVPAYRAAVDQRDEMHETYQNEIERNFVRVMFGGSYLQYPFCLFFRSGERDFMD